MKRKEWNPSENLALPIETIEPTEWDVGALFSGSDAEIAARFAIMAACSRHRFRALTDRLDRAQEWFAWFTSPFKGDGEWPTHAARMMFAAAEHIDGGCPAVVMGRAFRAPVELANLMIGAPVATQRDADERLAKLAEIPARFRFVRVEPAEVIYLDNLKLVGNRLAGWHSAPFGRGWDRQMNALTGKDQRGPWNQARGRRWSDSAPKQLPALDLVEIAGGPGAVQLRLVQQIGRQVLDAQTWDTPQERNPDRGSLWEYVETGPEQLVSGPALSIVAADVCPGCHGDPHGDCAPGWSRDCYVCLDGDRGTRTGYDTRLFKDAPPEIHIPGYTARVWGQQPVGWRP